MYLPRLAFYSTTPQQGKSTACNILRPRFAYLRASFADPLKAMIRALLKECLLSDEEIERYMTEAKEETIELVGASYRHVARTLGTEWGRVTIKESLWIDIMQNKINAASTLPTGFCIDDMRFPNELEMLKRNDFKFVKIVRDTERDLTQDQHVSDTALRDFDDFDHVIDNNGGHAELSKALERIVMHY